MQQTNNTENRKLSIRIALYQKIINQIDLYLKKDDDPEDKYFVSYLCDIVEEGCKEKNGEEMTNEVKKEAYLVLRSALTSKPFKYWSVITKEWREQLVELEHELEAGGQLTES
jgi:hypothetical protein